MLLDDDNRWLKPLESKNIVISPSEEQYLITSTLTRRPLHPNIPNYSPPLPGDKLVNLKQDMGDENQPLLRSHSSPR